MNKLNLSENITRLRHEKKLTQEELADYLGVTKASVSKWENAQSMPDILLLPQLAVFFGVTIDELIGYEAQLSSEQIRRCYAELSGNFASLPFDEAAGRVRAMARRYYSCYPLLLQLSALYWNHFMLAKTKEEGKGMLREAVGWCDRILDNCKDAPLCSDAFVLKAGLKLQLGKAAEVIDALEPASDPSRLTGQDGAMLIQAYQMAGKTEKAKSYVQVKEYSSLLNLVGNAILSLSLYESDEKRCEQTIQRVNGLMDLYQLEQLHPNIAAQFYCQAAIVYAGNGKHEEALKSLRRFETCIGSFSMQRNHCFMGMNTLICWMHGLSVCPLEAWLPGQRVYGTEHAGGLFPSGFCRLKGESGIPKNCTKNSERRGKPCLMLENCCRF